MIKKEVDLSWDEILYKRSWINIKMMLADAPKLQSKRNNSASKNKTVHMLAPEELAKQMGLK